MKKIMIAFCALMAMNAQAGDVVVPSGVITLMDDDVKNISLTLERVNDQWYFHADGRKYRVSDATVEELFAVASKKNGKDSQDAILDFVYTDESEWRKKTMYFFYHVSPTWERNTNSRRRRDSGDTPERNPLGILLEGILKGK